MNVESYRRRAALEHKRGPGQRGGEHHDEGDGKSGIVGLANIELARLCVRPAGGCIAVAQVQALLGERAPERYSSDFWPPRPPPSSRSTSRAIAAAPPSNENAAQAGHRSTRRSRPRPDCRAATIETTRTLLAS